MTVNELIAELIALREHHWCGDLDVVGVLRVWGGYRAGPSDNERRDAFYEFESVPLVRPRIARPPDCNSRVVELAPEPAHG